MARYNRFTFLINSEEKRLIEALAIGLDRSKSDAVRFVVMNAARQMILDHKEIKEALTDISLYSSDKR